MHLYCKPKSYFASAIVCSQQGHGISTTRIQRPIMMQMLLNLKTAGRQSTPVTNLPRNKGADAMAVKTPSLPSGATDML